MGVRGAVLAILTCGVALLPAPTSAQAPVPTHFGGGGQGSHNILVSVTQVGSSFVYRVHATALCPGGSLNDVIMKGSFQPASNGAFADKGKVTSPGLVSSVHITGSFTLAGTMGAGGGSGTTTAHVHYRGHGNSGKCRVFGNRGAWAVRPPAHPAGAPSAGPLPGTLFGTTTQAQGNFSYSVLVHPWKPKGRIYLVWEAGLKCRSGHAVYPFVNTSPALKPDAQGRFARHEHFKVQYADGLIRFRADTSGQLHVDGATGAIRLRQTVTRHGRVIDRCDSGAVAWTAAP